MSLSVTYFRSTSAIVTVSDAFAAAELGASRFEKTPRAYYNKEPRDFRVLWFNSRAEEADWVADRIQALLGTEYEEENGTVRGLTPADFAVIMRSTREPEQNNSPRHSAFTRALEERGIRYSLEAGGGPFGRPQVDILRSTFDLLRLRTPTRTQVQNHFTNQVIPAYPHANFDALVRVLTDWGRRIHTPSGGTRQRIYPQELVYELLESFRISESSFSDDVMREIGLFSRMIQDVEAVYMSVDSSDRFVQILNFLSNAAETGYNISTDDVVQRPDTVTMATVHKVKGLEFPVVFVVDIEAQRFPGRREGYRGWLPDPVMRRALNRGAYQRNDAEEARLFYTAITRAERYLYVTGAANLPGGRKIRRPSRFANRLAHDEISSDATMLPEGLTGCLPQQRIDDSILPTSFSEIRYYLRCPMDYRFRKGYGFTPPIPELFGYGKTVHTAIEKLHTSFTDDAPSIEDAESVALSVFHLKHVPRSGDPENSPGPYERAQESAVRIAKKYVQDFHEDFQRIREVEARFEIPAQGCVISGSIDLLLKQDAQGDILEAEVIDYKAIERKGDPTQEDIDWTELAVQVQLYAKAAQDVLGENAKTGFVHLLKNGEREEIPISHDAIAAAISNIEWAVSGIIAGDYPMRPHREKCANCDFAPLCPRIPQEFQFSSHMPPKIHLPDGKEHIRSFSQFESSSELSD